MKFFLVLLLLPFSAVAKDVYHIHRLSEKGMQKMYTQMLREACHHAQSAWVGSSTVPPFGFWGDGASSGNEGIRTIASMVLACATELKYDSALSENERKEFLYECNAALRYIVDTHVTGAKKCPDGKHWGATAKFGPESWQSGMWTGTFAFGSWLIWDKLDPGLQRDLERVIGWEDDILAKRPPPNGLWLDTKAEENGWEVPPLVLGELMFPQNAHAASWHETAVKYMMNTLCTEADTHDTNLVDGRPVDEWVHGANLQPDFTLENHNIFHPSYVGCSSYFMTQAALYYTYAGRPVPQAATHHLFDTWKMFQSVLLPWGEAAYPQGMDWELHGLPFLNLFATLATRDHDRFAARMEQQSLQMIRAWQLMDGGGDLSFPGSRFGITRHAINAEQASYGLIAHKVFGPAAPELSAREALDAEKGVREHDQIEFITDRTDKKFASFSWKNRIMGELIPIGSGHEDSPEFTVPIKDGLVGSFDLKPKGDVKTKVIDHSWKKTDDGFETTGTLLLNGGRLKQTLTVTSIGEQTLVYQDRVTALSNVTVTLERGVPVGIENDEISGDKRVVAHQDERTTFSRKRPLPVVRMEGSWANVDGRLAVVAVAGSGLAYVPGALYSPGICVRTDCLYASVRERPQIFKAGDEVAHRVAVFYLEVSPRETAALARTCAIKDGTLHFEQPSRQQTEIPIK